jgi:hypothetical protein
MNARRIPLVLNTEEANALIDTWEALHHDDAELTEYRWDTAFGIIDWIRHSLTATGKPPEYPLTIRVQQVFRNWLLARRYRWLQWKNRSRVHPVYLTDTERVALMRFLVLHKPVEELKPVIERLKNERE